MDASASHASPNAAARLRAADVAVPVVAALFLSFSDAFGLGVLPFAERFAYWLVLLGIGQALNRLLFFVTAGGSRPPRQELFAALLLCVAGAVPMSLIVWAVTAWVLHQPRDAGRLAYFYLAVLAVAAVMLAINRLARREALAATAGSIAGPRPQGEETASPALPAIIARLPARLKTAQIQALEAEDHYVRVHTSEGSDLVLLRLGDAIAELGGLDGAQVHRSWWVARDAVTETRVEDGKRILVLKDGSVAPVSRSFAKTLRAKGWFA